VLPGEPLSLSADIANIGNGNAPASSAVVRIGTGLTMKSDDTVAGTISVPMLTAGSSTTLAHSFVMPSLPAGTYYLFVSAADDVNLTNNVGRSAAVTVGGAAVCTVSCAAQVQGKLNALQALTFSLTHTPSCPPSVRWQFGDGDSSTSTTATHVYQRPGTYHWTVSVAAGTSTCESSGTIVIAPAPATRSRAVRH